jgi:hypothetical protein
LAAEITLRSTNGSRALVLSKPGDYSFVATLEGTNLHASAPVRTHTRELVAVFRAFAEAKEGVPDAHGVIPALPRWYSSDHIFELLANPSNSGVTLQVKINGRFSGWSASVILGVDKERFRTFVDEVAEFFARAGE